MLWSQKKTSRALNNRKNKDNSEFTHLTAMDARARSTIARARLTRTAAVVCLRATSLSAELRSDSACSPSDRLRMPSWWGLGTSSEHHDITKLWMINSIVKTVLLLLLHTFNGPFPGLSRWAGTRKVKSIWVKSIWIWLKQETVCGSGISHACLHLASDR